MSARVFFFTKLKDFFTVYLSVCGCVLANKSFRLLFFSYKLKHHHSALYRIENRGFKSCHISHFLFKYLRLVFVCLLVFVCVCVSLESGFVLFVLYLCWCLCSRQILRGNFSKTFSPQNFKLLS